VGDVVSTRLISGPHLDLETLLPKPAAA